MTVERAMKPLPKEVKTAVDGRTIIFATGAGAPASGPRHRRARQSLGADQGAKKLVVMTAGTSEGRDMKKISLLLLLAVLATVGSLGIAGAKACPPSSKNPGGTPPNCGHPAPSPTPTPQPTQTPPAATTCSTGGLQGGPTFANSNKNEDGALSGPIHHQLEPAVDGLAPVVHEVNCDVVVSLGL
jgi:hypothetical protein